MSEKATITPQATPAAAENVQSSSAQNDLHTNEVNQKKPECNNLLIQTKLTVGAPDDPYEKEADNVADYVMRMPEENFLQRKCSCSNEPTNHAASTDKNLSISNSASVLNSSPALPFLQKESLLAGNHTKSSGGDRNSFVQRKCAHCEDEEKINRKASNSITPFVQTKTDGYTPTVSSALSHSIDSSRGGGSPMDNLTETFMSSRFGSDFSSVKIHADSDAAWMNRNLNAKAFTVGQDVYFNEGQYRPDSFNGKQLLAHELTHVVQQQSGESVNRMIQRTIFGHSVQFDSRDSCPPEAEIQQSGIEETVIAEELYGDKAIPVIYIDEHNINVDYEHLLDEWKPVFKDCVSPEIADRVQPEIPAEQMQCRADTEFTGELEMTEATVKAPNGIRLHTTPDPLDCDYTNRIGVSAIVIAKGAKVIVIASGNVANGGWVKLQTQQGNEGWIEDRFISRTKKNDLKDAVTKDKYVIKPGDNLEGVINEQYKDYPYTTGNDRRTIAHALYILNKDESGAFYFEGNGESWWKDFLDSDFEESRKIYATIKLREGRVIRLPSKAYIDLLRDKGDVGVRPEWKNTAIEFARSIEGFVAGAVYGFGKALVDTLVGLWDLVKGIFSGELFEQAYDFYKQIEKNGIGFLWDLIKGFFVGVYKDFVDAWNNPNPYKKWFFFGEIVGMILFEIVVAFLTAGAGLAKHLGKLSKIFDAVPGLRKLASKAATKIDDIPSKEAAALSRVKSAEQKLENLGEISGETRKMLRDPANDKLIDSLIENPDIRPEDLYTGNLAGSSVPRGFKPDGTIPRAGTPERPVVNQGPHPTCGSRSCEMAAGTMGQTISPAMLEKMIAEAGNIGVTTDQMVQMLKWNQVVAEAKTGYKVADLATATKGGNPAIAVIKTTNPKHPLHAVVVDGVTERLGQPVVAIRNPWGIQYFQTVDEFNKVFTGNAVTILHSY